MSATPSITAYITFPGSQGKASLLDVAVTSASVFNQQYPSGGSIYDAWCLIETVQLPVPATYSAFVYSTYELNLLKTVPSLSANKNLANLDNINWLLNWYDGSNAAYGDVQGAIWKMMGTVWSVNYVGPQDTAKIDALVAEALAHDGYVPDAGENIAVMLDPMQGSSHRQPLVITTKAAAIGDYVWHDLNANGRQDSGETGIAGATVKLVRDQNLDGDFNDVNEVIATTTTDAAGAYAFKGLTAGLTYQVQFSLPTGFDATSPRQSDGSPTSGVNSDALVSAKLVLAPGEKLTSVDAGFYRLASLGDRLWLDANGNGQQDSGESGIANTTVTLIGGGADGLLATGADNTSTVALTGADGAYVFNGLTPGAEYQVQFAKPVGSVFTRRDAGNDATDSDADDAGKSQVVKLASGENLRSVDAGVYLPASLGDRVWHDMNGNGQQDAGEAGIDGVTVTLSGGGADGLLDTTADNTTLTTTTSAGGAYRFDGLAAGAEYQVRFGAPSGYNFTLADRGLDGSDSDAGIGGRAPTVVLVSGEHNGTIDAGVYRPASLGNRVWLDANANGRQDAGELGVAGATVTLMRADGGADISVTTGADGSYAFTDLTPGKYQVRFDAPAGAVLTGANQGDDAADSDAGAGGLSGWVTLASGANDDTVDAGVYVPARLGNRVWLDANGNGQQDAGELGAAGVTVTLVSGGADGIIATAQDNTSVSAVTGADGSYEFTGLTPATEYQVTFNAPAGSVFTKADQGDDALDSDAQADGATRIVTLASGESNQTIDAGIYTPASLGDRVWLDANGNGRQDAGEQGIAGVAITLTGGGADGLLATTQDNTSVSTVSAADGSYGFDQLTPGAEYQVQFAAPTGLRITERDRGDDSLDSDAGPDGASQVVKLKSGEHNGSIDAGFYAPAALGDRVWLDADGNGRQDAGELGVAGVTVTLHGGGADGLLATLGDNTKALATTGADGRYGFEGLAAGVQYQVGFDKPAGSVFTTAEAGDEAGDSDALAGGLSHIVTLRSGELDDSIDAGIYLPASLGDKVWLDANANGVQDDGERGVGGVTVTLVRADQSRVSTTTAADGSYRFGDLAPGAYQIAVSAPQGSIFTAANVGNDGRDSDVDANGLSHTVTLRSGDNDDTIDAGIYAPASLGDKVWLDANGNGRQDAGELGVAGVGVTLIGGGADGLVATESDNTRISTVTGADGSYAFTNLKPSTEYQVQFNSTAGAVFTSANVGADTHDSDASETGLTGIVVLASGESNTTIDAGIYLPAALGDRVWLDANGDGVQDAGEAGIGNVQVTLTSGGADGLVATGADNVVTTTATAADGSYAFTGLRPGMEYQVSFDKPAGSVFTRAGAGTDATDSDADAQGVTKVVTLNSGETRNTIDAGVYVPASIGDRVWIDANGNGSQDEGESGAAGVTVTLVGGGADGIIATAADNTKASMTTGSEGEYLFAGLTPGVEYQVGFGKLAGMDYTRANLGSDDTDSDAGSDGRSQIVKLGSGEHVATIDAGLRAPASLGDRVWLDANANGQQDSGEAGIEGVAVTLLGGGADGLLSTALDNTSATVVSGANGAYRFDGLSAGVEYQVSVAAGAGAVFTQQNSGDDTLDSDVNAQGLSQVVKLVSGENNSTLDAGVYLKAALGDRLWDDLNGNGRQDDGASGIAGATVTLIGGGADGSIATAADNTQVVTTTGADGTYLFDGLRPGVEYQVQFSKPAGSSFTRQDHGLDDGDSDVGADGLSQVVVLASGESNRSIDAGIVRPASLGDRLWLDANGDGQQDSAEAGVAGQSVTLIGGGADGLIATTLDNTSVTTVTAADGSYRFGNLRAGEQYQVQFAKPADHSFTAKDRGLDASDSDVGSDGLSQVVTLASGEHNGSIDAGLYVAASLGDRAWHDANANGKQDSGEVGVAGGTVTLIGGGADGLISTTMDNTKVSTTTGADGSYLFSNLTPGMEYQVQFSKPADAVFSARDVGDDVLDSDVDASGLSQIVKLSSGEFNKTIDAGGYMMASLGDRVWVDANGNGQQDLGEAGLGGVTVTLQGGGADGSIATVADNTSISTVTAADGSYLFTNLKPGTQYQVQFAKPADMQFTKAHSGLDASDSDADQGTGKSQVVTLASGETNRSIDAGVYATASLGDRLWVDTNANGVQDDGATGLAGREVILLGGGADGLLSTGADNTRLSMLTGTDGAFNFTNLTPGVQYQVQFSKPTGYVYTEANMGLDTLDSDAASATGLTQVVVMSSGQNDRTLDAGVVNVTGDLSVTKTDGITSVLPGQNITYTIVVKNTGTALATDALVTDVMPTSLTNITWTSSAMSGASGNQASGTGSINDYVTLAGGASITYTVKAQVAGMAALEKVSDFGTLTNNTSLGQNTTVNGVRADAYFISSGYQTTSTVLWERNAGNDKGLGVVSRYETATTSGDVSGLSNQTNAEVIRLTKAAGEQWSSLWVSDLDAGGSGGAEIGTLYWSNSATPDLATLSTKHTFKYGDFGVGATEGNLLTLRPANFDATAKYVFFVAGPNASGTNNDYLVWKAGTIPTQVVNTAAVTAPKTFVDTNAANNSAVDTDALAVPTPPAIVRGSIGDLVWEDTNYNGIRDTGEAGIANVTVKLLDANNVVLATTTTNSAGAYLFNNLNAGSYKVEVIEPANYFVTKRDAGSNGAIDSDLDAATGHMGIIELSQGETQLNWDAGLYRKASLGDKVWQDVDHDDIQDAGESGIIGIKVMLYNSANVLVASTVTNSTGNYKFSNLNPGNYYLKFDKSNVTWKTYDLDTWKWASKNIGSNDAIDSDTAGDGVVTTGVTRTDTITLSSGENDMSWDAGITPIAIDLNGDGVHTVARADSQATFDLLGNGSAIRSGWLTSTDGFLAVDVNGNGSIDDIGELFGGSAKGSGFARLAGFDSNGDGQVNAQDSEFASLLVWQDANGNHRSDAGELLSLAQAGVQSLAVAYVEVPFVDAQGNLHLERSSATLSGGATVDMTDVYFAVAGGDVEGYDLQSIEELVGGAEVAQLVGVQAVEAF